MRRHIATRLATGVAGLALFSACGSGDQAAPEGDVAAMEAAETGPSMSGDRIPTATGGELIVHPVHHGTLVISWDGNVIYVDPAGAPGAGGEGSAAAVFEGLPAATLVLVTDVHGDHLSVPTLADVSGGGAVIIAPAAVVDQLPDDLKSRARPLANSETTAVGTIQVEAVPMYNTSADRLQFHEKGRGNGYVLTLGGTRVYIAGDTEDVPEMRALQNIDVAFLPMNVPYTMTPEQAADAVLAFRPRIVYPYHYGESDVAQFGNLVGTSNGVEVRLRNWYP